MCGCWSESSACWVAAGTPELVTNRIGLPLSAAHPAAGIAYCGSSAEAMTTSGLGLPAAAVANRSMAAVSVNGSLPLMAIERMPLTRGTDPTRITWAPSAEPDPAGANAFRVVAVIGGSEPGPESRSGARIGQAISTEAAIAASQSLVGASATTGGCVPGATEG